MTKNPLSGATRARASAPIVLSSALCRPTSSRTGDLPVPPAPRRGVDGAGRAIEGLLRLEFAQSPRGSRLRRDRGPADASGGRGEGIWEKSSIPQRPQPVRPLIARPRAICACNRSPVSAILSFQPSSTGFDLEVPDIGDAIGDLLGQGKARGEIFEIAAGSPS